MKKCVLLVFLILMLCGAAGMALADEDDSSENRPHPEIGTVALQDNGIPVVYLTIDPEEYRNVLESQNHSYQAKGASIRITVPEGYVCEYGTFDASFSNQELPLDSVRGRGHSTWTLEKRPFRITFAEKTDLFGLGCGKNWALMANAYDISLLRNHIAGYIGSAMGLAYTPKFVAVDLVINGNYMGSYQLSPYVQIAENSLNIEKVKQDATDEPDISGGYLLDMAPYSVEPEVNVITTRDGISFGIKTPNLSQYSEDMHAAQQAQRQYIQNLLQQVEDAIYGEKGISPSGTHYSELMDVRSAAAYWLIQAFSVNGDAFRTSSTYLYKEKNQKLFWGPLWDFDIAFQHLAVDGDLNAKMLWLDYLRQYDEDFRQILRDTWAELDKVIQELTREGGILDQYGYEIRSSWENNKRLWNTTDADLAQVIRDMKKDFDLRRQAINDQLEYELTHVLAPVTFIDGDSVYAVVQAYQRSGLDHNRFPAAPQKDGSTFVRWVNKSGETFEPYTPLSEPVTVYAEYAPAK